MVDTGYTNTLDNIIQQIVFKSRWFLIFKRVCSPIGLLLGLSGKELHRNVAVSFLNYILTFSPNFILTTMWWVFTLYVSYFAFFSLSLTKQFCNLELKHLKTAVLSLSGRLHILSGAFRASRHGINLQNHLSPHRHKCLALDAQFQSTDSSILGWAASSRTAFLAIDICTHQSFFIFIFRTSLHCTI